MTPIIWICAFSLCILWHDAFAAALDSINAMESQLMCLNSVRTALDGSPSGANAAASWRRALSALTRSSASDLQPAIQRADLAPYRVLKIIEACDQHANLTCKMVPITLLAQRMWTSRFAKRPASRRSHGEEIDCILFPCHCSGLNSSWAAQAEDIHSGKSERSGRPDAALCAATPDSCLTLA